MGRVQRWWRWGTCTIEVDCEGTKHRLRPVDLHDIELLDGHTGTDRNCERVAAVWRAHAASATGGRRSGVVPMMREAVGGAEVRTEQEWRVLGLRIAQVVSGRATTTTAGSR